MVDAQSNTSEKESSPDSKKGHPEEFSEETETDDEILNTDIRKEMSEIEKDREKFEKDFAQLLSTNEDNTDDNSEELGEEENEDLGILLPKSHNFGTHKPKTTHQEKKSSGLIIEEEEKSEETKQDGEETSDISDIKSDVKDADTTGEEKESIVQEESQILEEDQKTNEEYVDDQTDPTEEKEEEKQSVVQKIKNLFRQTEIEIEPYDADIHGPITEFKAVDGYEEVERYWVNEPYAFIVILYNEERNTHLYYIVEPELTDFEHTFLLEIKDRLRDVLLVEEIDEEADDREAVLESKIRSIIKDFTIEITPPMLEKISYYIKRDFVRFGKIDALMMDDSIEDVSGNGHDLSLIHI